MSTILIQRAADGERDLPVFAELAKRMDAVRERAFEMFAQRGGESGHDLDDWVAAEHEVLGWPAAALKEVNGAFEVDVTLPGFEAQEVEVTATPSEVVIHAAATREASGEDGALLWSEFGSNDVYRRFGFPRTVDADKVTASLHNGMLTVRAPKADLPAEAATASTVPATPQATAEPKGDAAIDVPISG